MDGEAFAAAVVVVLVILDNLAGALRWLFQIYALLSVTVSVAVSVFGGAYFAPSIVALCRGGFIWRQSQAVGVLLLNLLLGWTLLGWVGALLWAVLFKSPAEALAARR